MADVVEKQGKTAKTWKQKPVLIPFVREGQRTTDRQESKSLGILDQSQHWQLAVDLQKKLKFSDIVPTNIRLCFSHTDEVELTVPW